jgi:hypothetical protein
MNSDYPRHRAKLHDYAPRSCISSKLSLLYEWRYGCTVILADVWFSGKQVSNDAKARTAQRAEKLDVRAKLQNHSTPHWTHGSDNSNSRFSISFLSGVGDAQTYSYVFVYEFLLLFFKFYFLFLFYFFYWFIFILLFYCAYVDLAIHEFYLCPLFLFRYLVCPHFIH